jgi:hypothetical protein
MWNPLERFDPVAWNDPETFIVLKLAGAAALAVTIGGLAVAFFAPRVSPCNSAAPDTGIVESAEKCRRGQDRPKIDDVNRDSGRSGA